MLLTVGMPLYQAEKIGWLAFEGLCRQVYAKSKKYDWQVVVYEDSNLKYQPMGSNAVFSFYDRLKLAGCSKLVYLSNSDKRIAPSQKWIEIANYENPLLGYADYVLVQDADCFSFPTRIYETWNAVKCTVGDADHIHSDIDWIHSHQGVFYNIKTEHTALFRKHRHTGLNMAFRASALFNNPHEVEVKNPKKFRGLNYWLYYIATKWAKGSDLKPVIKEIGQKTWESGLDTHGYNTITTDGRSQMIENANKKPFYPYHGNINKHIPAFVMSRLRSLKHDEGTSKNILTL